MSPRPDRLEDLIANSLDAVPCVSTARPGRRDLTVASAVRVPLSMSVEHEWLALQCPPLVGPVPVTTWEALHLNDGIPGGAKLILPAGDTRIAARTDVWLGDRPRLPKMVRRACEALRMASRACGWVVEGEEPASPQPVATTTRATGLRILPATTELECAGSVAGPSREMADLAAMLDALGWRIARRSDTGCTLDLRVHGPVVEADVERRAGDAVRIRAALVTHTRPSPATRLAAGVHLLGTTAAVRLVRAGTTWGSGGTTVYLETWAEASAPADDYQRGVAALAAACQMLTTEVRTLGNERMAKAYLKARGWDEPGHADRTGER